MNINKVEITKVIYNTHEIIDEVTIVISVYCERDPKSPVGVVIYREHTDEYSDLDSFVYYGVSRFEVDAIREARSFVAGLGSIGSKLSEED